jgi:uncharacterized membrane protein YphA (DoxX/SURF4 family)
LQRLFSTFANGWPGLGILLLRLVTSAALVHYGIADRGDAHHVATIGPQIITAVAAILLLVGLWTPVVGTLLGIIEVWRVFFGAGDPWIPIILAALGTALALIGPGAWSIDAQLFGRKRFEIPKR